MKHFGYGECLVCLVIVLALTVTTVTCTGVNTPVGETKTPLSVARTNSPLVVPTSSSPSALESGLIYNCIETINTYQGETYLSGTLVMSTVGEGVTLLDLKTGNRNSIDASLIYHTAVSPSRTKIAYISRNLRAIIISDAAGSQIGSFPNPENRLIPAQWLDENHLALNKLGAFDNPSDSNSLMILNTITGETTELSQTFPDFNSIFGHFQWAGYNSSRMVPNPELTHLIYPATGNNLIVWDIGLSREVQRIYGVDQLNAPWWSPDGNNILASAPVKAMDYNGNLHINVEDGMPYVGGNELLSISKTGVIKRLTYLTTQYEAKEFSYVWSPDSQKIAFWLEIQNQSELQLALLNVNTGKVTNLCLSTNASSWSPITWSLDGNHLALSVMDRNLNETVFIIDIQQYSAIQVASNAKVFGWMKSEP
jgi:hypothetical protein